MPAAIRHAKGDADIALARALFEEYAAWLGVDLCFQGFAEELATLPGAYAPPAGRLMLAGEKPGAFGCIALRPLADSPQSSHGCRSADQPPGGALSREPERAGVRVGEVKRLYVQPDARRGGWGHRLADALINEARAIGYRELKLDTLEWMDDARKLYARLGFVECDAYYRNPLPGVVYMRCGL
jgi:GNAT superfamily N-acetyltransferase